MSKFQPKYRNLVEIFEQSVRSFADRPLFGTKKDGAWVWMTYREFGQQVDAARGGLAGLGVAKGDAVSMIANNRPEWAVAAYATYGLGASFVPMYESQLAKEWAYILKDCGAKVLFVANEKIRDGIEKYLDELPELQHVVLLEGAPKGDAQHTFAKLVEAAPVPVVAVESSDIAGFIYTSGTTGNPKGVLLSHENIASNVSAVHEIFPMSPDDRSLSFLPWAHSFGQTCELHALLSMGASMGIAEAVDKIVANLAEVRPTLLFSVPRIFNRIYDNLHKKMAEEGGLKESLFNAAIANADYRKRLTEERKRSGWADFKQGIFDKLVFSKVRERFGGRLKYAFSGGAALSREVAEFIDNLGIMVYEGYGLTETSPIATANCPSGRKIGSVGKPIPGVFVDIDLSVSDDPKQGGEIVIYGHNVMQGYHHLPEENEKVLVEKDGVRGFRSGDLGYVDGDGFLYITGRIKEQYKLINGKYVVPTPLEERLKLSPFIANVMVHGANHNHNAALIVPDLDSLSAWAKDHGLPTDPVKLCEDPKVRELYTRELAEWSKEFKSFEKIHKFTLIPEDFTTDNGMLTPSMKLKRRVVLDRYGAEWDALFAD
ncbi:MAG: long-chain fatty acid--CoA ligase [Myxococcales bacterium]|nr:long-chain fatty acid--CoA ligase [Myxococcales bacterium]